MLATVVVLIALVKLVQFAGNALAKRLNKKEM
jgi:ABC-type methionine transport system permease subunit